MDLREEPQGWLSFAAHALGSHLGNLGVGVSLTVGTSLSKDSKACSHGCWGPEVYAWKEGGLLYTRPGFLTAQCSPESSPFLGHSAGL